MKYPAILSAIGLISIAACSQLKQEMRTAFSVEPIVVPAINTSAEPFLYRDDSAVFLSWVEKADTTYSFKLSKFENEKWTEPVTIATGSTWFVNWADYPMLAAKGPNMIAHFLDKSGAGKYAYDVKLTLSSDEGKTWSTPNILNDDKKEAEHGFATLVPYGDNFFVTWLDGRNTVMEGMEGMDHHDGHHGAMSLRAAVVDYSGKKINEWELDNKTCDCCQTSATVTSSGPVVVYRDRSDDEIRDMSIVRLAGNEWTEPASIHNDNWKIAGCPVNGPRVAAQGNALAVAWFSMTDDKSRVNVKFSTDCGTSFGDVIRIDEGNAIGRVDIELIDETTALVTWMEGGDIKLARITSDGSKQSSFTVASSSNARSSGFPQLTVVGSRAIIAWTDDKEKAIKSAWVNF